MKILLIHGNYPAQFRHLAVVLGRRPDVEVVYLTQHDYPNRWPIEGVRVETYPAVSGDSAQTHPYLRGVQKGVRTGQSIARAVDRLRQEGFVPNQVIFHAGNGLGLFLRDVLPQSRLIGYFEWYFQAGTSRYLSETFTLDLQLALRIRNMPILSELVACDLAVVPTAWQRQQFPPELQAKLHVIFDGIDTAFFQPDPSLRQQVQPFPLADAGGHCTVHAGAPLLTYATRGMEPLRGFPEFMRALPPLLAALPDLHVMIAGQDRVCYSYRPPSHQGSWKQLLLAELRQRGDVPLERVHFTGLLNFPDYRRLLQRSTLHCSFTRPYVTSWSVVEAIACGTPLALAEGPATAAHHPWSVVRVNLDATSDELACQLQPHLLVETSPALPPFPAEWSVSACLRQWWRLLQS